MKVMNDIAAAVPQADSRSSEPIDAGEFAALLAGIAGIALTDPLQLVEPTPATTSDGPTGEIALQLHYPAAVLANLGSVDLAGDTTSAVTATPTNAVVDVEIISVSVGHADVPVPVVETDIDLPAPLLATDAPATDAGGEVTAVSPDAKAKPVETAPPTTVSAAVIVDTTPETVPAVGSPDDEVHVAAKKEELDVTTGAADTAKDTAPVKPAAGPLAALTTRQADATKMTIPPARIDAVAVAAARASAEADRPIRLSVRLDPPNLGELRVELTARGNQVTIRLEPTATNVGQTLSQQRSAIAEALERTGFQLSGFDIANPEPQQQQQHASEQRRNTRLGAIDDIEQDDSTPLQGLRI